MPFVFCLDSFCSVHAVNSSFFNPPTSFVTFLFGLISSNLITPFLSPFVFAQRLYVLWVIPSMSMSLSPALPSSIFFLFYAVIYFKLYICICCMLWYILYFWCICPVYLYSDLSRKERSFRERNIHFAKGRFFPMIERYYFKFKWLNYHNIIKTC